MKVDSSLLHIWLLLWRLVDSQPVWINEFHYDNSGTDNGEFIELGHTVSLNGVRLLLQGLPGPFESTLSTISEINLSGLAPSSTVNGISYTVIDTPLPDGPAGFLLLYPRSSLLTLSYEGPMVAEDETSIDVGVFESETTPLGYSLQKCPDADQWVGPIPNTRGTPNPKCASPSPSSEPSSIPSFYPTESPTVKPSVQPTQKPSNKPSQGPSLYPSSSPTRLCPFQWNVYHSRSNKKVDSIVDGTIIRNPPPCRFINIEAVPLCDIDSDDGIVMELYQGNNLIERRTDRKAKYFLFGNIGDDVLDGSIPAGTYSIRAIVDGGISPSITFTLGGKCG